MRTTTLAATLIVLSTFALVPSASAGHDCQAPADARDVRIVDADFACAVVWTDATGARCAIVHNDEKDVTLHEITLARLEEGSTSACA